MHVRNSKNTAPTVSPHGEIVQELMGTSAGGTQQHSLALITLPPGKQSLKHYHPEAEESYTLLAGNAQLTLDDQVIHLFAGDSVAIPPGCVHQVTNTGDDNLVFLAVCVPPWTPACSVFIDEDENKNENSPKDHGSSD